MERDSVCAGAALGKFGRQPTALDAAATADLGLSAIQRRYDESRAQSGH